MIKLIRTNSDNQDFINLVSELDKLLKVKDGEEHEFYSQYNKVHSIKHVLLAYKNEVAVGCGAFKIYAKDAVGIKRMFVLPNSRGKGVATKILLELEAWASDLLFSHAVLETGKNLPDAISLYTKHGYQKIANYGQYKNVSNSVCFNKKLITVKPR